MLGVLAALGVATTLSPAESTIEFLSLRPIDTRTYTLILTTALCGPVTAWTLNTPPARARLGKASRFWLSLLVAGALAAITIALAEVGTGTSIVLGMMAGLQAATASLFMALYVRTAPAYALALLACGVVACFGLLPTVQNGFAPVGLLVPTYWVGDILVAKQLGRLTGSANMVGLTYHLLPLVIALGLTLLEEDPRDAP